MHRGIRAAGEREASSGARKALAATGIVLAVAFAFACGVSYMMTSRPVWNTVALPLAYLGTALATGAACTWCCVRRSRLTRAT